MTTSVRDAYLAEVQALWPQSPPAYVRTSRGPTANTLTFLPNSRHPRLLVPSRKRAAASRALLRFSAGLEAGDTTKRVLVAGVVRAGAGSWFRDRIVPGPLEGSIQEYLATVLGAPVVVSLGIGSARANRKPVLQVFDGQGRSIAFAKVGSNREAGNHVSDEASGLREVNDARLPDHMDVPGLLHVGKWNHMPVVVMSALPTWMFQRPRRQWSIPWVDMSAFARSFDEGRSFLQETALWSGLETTSGALSDPNRAERLARILERLADRSSGVRLDVGAWHGDWTPWNMSRRGKRLQLWDFERFQRGVPLGMDGIHYGVNAVLRRDGVTPATVRAGLDHARSNCRLATETWQITTSAYLTAVSARYLQQGEGTLGSTVEERADVMLTAAEESLALPTQAWSAR